ncbi:MAG: T9SS type A sorting domain-containing protein [Chitinophagia bacterium]
MCFITQLANAQMTMAYSMGVLGGDLKLSNSSNPLTVNMANCIQVSNGVTKFLTTNNGLFINECIVDLNYSKISIQVLPNPFIDAVYVTFKSKIDKDNHFKISVFNNMGQLVKIENVNQDLFYTGYRVVMSNIPSGIYMMQISSSKVNEIFKIMKND